MSGKRISGRTVRGWKRWSVTGRDAWDAAIGALGGSVLQSWDWGEWYRHWGFDIERVRVDGPPGTGLAQVMIWPHGPGGEAYLARGPVLSADRRDLSRALFAAIGEVCERFYPLTLTVEPPALPGAAYRSVKSAREVERWCCPGRTIVVPLLDDESLLERMRKKTRQQVRRSERHGVAAGQVVPDAANLTTFYALLDDTARRTEFEIEPLSYYKSFMRHLSGEAVLLLARTEAGVAAGLIMTCFGQEAIAHFGASSTRLREPGTTAYLYFQAMRLARARGCNRMDLWGLPEEDPPPIEGRHPQGSHGLDWRGIQHFKLGLGGDIVAFPPPLKRRYPARWWAPWRRG